MRILIGTRHRTRVRHGLVLLLALGMLALFSLLAVTYVVSASNSRAGAQAMKIRANASANATTGMTDLVLRQALRGTRDQKSVFYQHSLLEDVYGQHPIRGRFGHLTQLNNTAFFSTSPPVNGVNPWCFRLQEISGNFAGTARNFVKLSLYPKSESLYPQNAGNAESVLSPFENAYSSRLITILEGPLAGKSFRILKYVGYIRTGSGSSNLPDPNYQLPIGQTIQINNGEYIDYSVLLDLSEVSDEPLVGTFYNFITNNQFPFRGNVDQWLALDAVQGLQSLFYRIDIDPLSGARRPFGYAFVINDAAFNSPGVGIADVDDRIPPNNAPFNPDYGLGFGNLDSRRVMAIPSTPDFKKIPPALLPNYDYLQDPSYVNPIFSSLGSIRPRTSQLENILRGGSNEGYDVPDWRDFWLAHQSNLSGPSGLPPTPSANIIPSFHRPEIVHYLAQAVGSSPGSNQLAELVRLVDASTGRIMSYTVNGQIAGQNRQISVNPQFSPHPDFPRLQTNNPNDVIEYVAQQIIGPWDVDNDIDGTADSVWVDPNLPTVKSPDGKLLKPLAAVLIQDLDGRINVNLHGDRSQADGTGFDSAMGAAFNLNTFPAPQGLGFGPADTSLRPLRDLGVFRPQAFLTGPPFSNLSFFDDRYGVGLTVPDGLPGTAGNDFISFLHARDNAWPFNHGNPAASSHGAPLGIRSDVYPSFDRYGNLAYQSNLIQGAKTNSAINDAYELRTLNLATSDDPFTVMELETILRKFDEDAAALPSRLKDKFLNIDSIRAEITRLLTTRSVELRHPPLAAAMTKQLSSNLISAATNNPLNPEFYNIYGNLASRDDANLMGMQGLIKMLHEQRYRTRSIPANSATDDPELTIADINVLFGQEFAQGKKLNINRPFGNGSDDNGNGLIDEPGENEAEDRFQYPDTVTGYTFFPQPVLDRGINRAGSLLRAQLGSRQVLARNLYCLAQLIVPRDFRFPNMPPSMRPDTDTFDWYRVRAYNLAQWAINVVDFRDGDATCTRFEYDIFPFGVGTGLAGINQRPPFWAPDLLPYVINPPSPPLPPPYRSYTRDFVKPFIGVVWGMEMPELLLTESLAFHDKRLRDTDLDNNPSGGRRRFDGDPQTVDDPDLDQYRFPQGSLFLELYAPRTTSQVGSDSESRVDSWLYVNDNGRPRLNLQAVNTRNEPIWRIGISEVHTPPDPNNPNSHILNTSPNLQYQSDIESISSRSLEFSSAFEPQNGGTIEQEIGSGLDPLIRDVVPNPVPSPPPPNSLPPQFDRIIWFLKRGDSQTSLHNASLTVPDLRLHANVAENKRNQVYHLRTEEDLWLSGGEYLTLMPRVETPVGSLNYNPNTTDPWPKQLLRTAMVSPSNRPVYSPSGQRLSIAGGRCQTTLLNGADSLLATPWRAYLATAPHRAVVIGTNIPYGSGNNANPAWTTGFPIAEGVGLNVSMPHPINGRWYWQPQNAPDQRLNSDAAAGFTDFDTWLDTNDVMQLDPTNNATKFKDQPFDYDDNVNPVLANTANPMNRTGTYPNVRTAYLQRLADPRREYDAVYNPYLTVDWISIDLTVFNGEAPMGSDAMEDDPNDLVDITNDLITSTRVSFQSRYKDGDEGLVASQKASLAQGTAVLNQPTPIGIKSLDGTRSRWGLSYHSTSTAQLRETPIQSSLLPTNRRPYFPIQLGYASQLDANNLPVTHNSATTFGYANVGYHFGSLEITNSVASQFDGVGPPQPPVGLYAGFPSDLTNPVWLNRPFATTHELMMVPFTSAARYGISWNVQSPQGDARHMFTTQLSFLETNPSKVDSTSVILSPSLPDQSDPVRRGAWGQFDARGQNGNGPTESDMGILLDFVELPSPYSDSAIHYHGQQIHNQVRGPSSTLLAIQQRFLGLQSNDGTLDGGTLVPPYNESSTFRAPGKVNLNTMTRLSLDGSIPALRAIEYLYAKEANGVLSLPVAQYDEPFFLNRRGYQPLVADLFTSTTTPSTSLIRSRPHLNAYFPTQFAGAYRPQLSSVFAPDITRVTTPNTPPPIPAAEDINNDPHQNANEQLRSRFSVESGILRSQDTGQGRNERDIDMPRDTIPRFSPGSVLQNLPADRQINPNSPIVSDANRNAFTRYQRMMRLPNLVTDQSNVFAVWVTVGLFEYDPITGFGREYVNASGEEQRERSFYIIDRTVPVGFVPGEDLNTQKAILLRRKISGER